MDKRVFLEDLYRVIIDYQLGLGSFALLNLDSSVTTLQKLKNTNIGGNEFALDEVVKIISSRSGKHRDEIFFDFYTSVFHSSFTRVFELIKLYCRLTYQVQDFETASWYHVSRMIRNCFSHDQKIHYSTNDKENLPYEWKDISLSLSMDNSPILWRDISQNTLSELLNAMIGFAENLKEIKP